MSKAQLQTIIDHKNLWGSFKKEQPININTLTTEQANDLYETIDCGLSPENLHCDGEISRTQAMKKYRAYMGAVKELQKMGFAVPDTCYEIEA